MSDFLENFNQAIEDKAGILGAAGGLAVLKGQEALREKLASIDTQLQKAENRVEREALVMRKLVDFESKAEIFTDETNRFLDLNAVNEVLESEGYMLATYGIPSNSLTELESIRFAKKTELKAKLFTERAYIIQKYKGAISTIVAANNLAYQLYELSLDEVLDKKFKKNSTGYYCGENVVSFISELFAPGELDFLKLGEVDLCELKNKYKESFMQENSPICIDFINGEIVRVDLSSLEKVSIGGKEVMDGLIEFTKNSPDFDYLLIFRSIDVSSNSDKIAAGPKVSVTKFNPFDGKPLGDDGELIVYIEEGSKEIEKKLSKLFNITNGPLTKNGNGKIDYIIESKSSDINEIHSIILKIFTEVYKYNGKLHFDMFNIGARVARNKSCFVATTIYGDIDHPQVQKLRNFRDARLNNSIAGRYFIKFYYFIGPTLALLPRSSKLAKRVLRHILDRF